MFESTFGIGFNFTNIIIILLAITILFTLATSVTILIKSKKSR